MAKMKSILNNRRPVGVRFTDTDVFIMLSDGSTVSNPLVWHEWLKDATPEQRTDYELFRTSIFWPQLDEGLDLEAILLGIQPRQPIA